ncbi:hypothetical protein ACFY6E_12445 [Staphylococcus cohnii]|uniref:hypothetical protein n=1 Tax=Staphylococcus cohnii TaxID=29382 RepID=UPI0036C770ED
MTIDITLMTYFVVGILLFTSIIIFLKNRYERNNSEDKAELKKQKDELKEVMVVLKNKFNKR